MRLLLLASVVVLAPVTCFGSLIGAGDVILVPPATSGSGNGTLDLRMFTFSGSEIPNQQGAFNGDNGNNTLPHNGGTSFFNESYVTTAGEVQAYYILNFPNGSGGSTVDEIVLFIDFAEESGVEDTNNGLAVVDYYLNPTTIGGSPNPAGDVTSDEQAAIDQVFTGGTLLAGLSSPLTLSTVAEGGGHADYAIFTGINPFSLSASDVLLLNVSMTGLSNGSEEVFLSGEFSGEDVMVAVPEASPFKIGVLLCGAIGLVLGGRRLKAKLFARD